MTIAMLLFVLLFYAIDIIIDLTCRITWIESHIQRHNGEKEHQINKLHMCANIMLLNFVFFFFYSRVRPAQQVTNVSASIDTRTIGQSGTSKWISWTNDWMDRYLNLFPIHTLLACVQNNFCRFLLHSIGVPSIRFLLVFSVDEKLLSFRVQLSKSFDFFVYNKTNNNFSYRTATMCSSSITYDSPQSFCTLNNELGTLTQPV